MIPAVSLAKWVAPNVLFQEASWETIPWPSNIESHVTDQLKLFKVVQSLVNYSSLGFGSLIKYFVRSTDSKVEVHLINTSFDKRLFGELYHFTLPKVHFKADLSMYKYFVSIFYNVFSSEICSKIIKICNNNIGLIF